MEREGSRQIPMRTIEQRGQRVFQKPYPLGIDGKTYILFNNSGEGLSRIDRINGYRKRRQIGVIRAVTTEEKKRAGTGDEPFSPRKERLKKFRELIRIRRRSRCDGIPSPDHSCKSPRCKVKGLKIISFVSNRKLEKKEARRNKKKNNDFLIRVKAVK